MAKNCLNPQGIQSNKQNIIKNDISRINSHQKIKYLPSHNQFNDPTKVEFFASGKNTTSLKVPFVLIHFKRITFYNEL